MDIKAKLRPFYIARMLYENTDEEHYLTIAQIMDTLEKEYGISTSRGTVGDDIRALQEFGMDIMVEPSTQNRYYLLGRTFDLPELKALIDATESAKFITKEKSDALVSKLCSLTSNYAALSLTRHIDVENRIKSENEKVYYIIDALNEAINTGKKVSFQYFTYNVRKQKKLKYDGFTYVFSPYKLIWKGDYYYAVGYSDKHDNVSSFRADRICHIEITEEKAVKKPGGFSLEKYSRQIFEMYDGDTVRVKLKCRNEHMKYVIDRFGENVETEIADEDNFYAYPKVALSPNFYSWVFKFAGEIRIISPAKAVTEISTMAQQMIIAESI